ncbi:MAG: BofC C-terminal domain-containing protein [Eubacteriales bacterium]|nr:BofC C-terminal domain-containing protein [Eubacteriales bacterium]
MDLKPEKIKLLTNVIYYAMGCVIVAALAALCIMISAGTDKGTDIENVTQSVTDTAAVQNTTSPADAKVQSVPKKYYIIEEDGRICIYEIREGENVFYDYGAVEKNLMTEEMQFKLKNGIYINSEPELYEFLQTYSS